MREGEREGGREGGRERGREGGREGTHTHTHKRITVRDTHAMLQLHPQNNALLCSCKNVPHLS